MPSDYTLNTKKTWDETIRELAETFEKWGIRQWRTDPQRPPLRGFGEAKPTVTLYYTIKGRNVVLVSKAQSTARDNLRVLYLVVEALRLNERRGLAETAADAYRQTYPALPAPGQAASSAVPPGTSGAGDPYAVLFVQHGAPLAVCEAAYRALAKAAHPDSTSNQQGDARMAALSAAIATIRTRQS